MEVLLLQVKEPQGLLASQEQLERFSPSGFRGNIACQCLDFGLLASGTVTQEISIVLSYSVYGTF